MLTLNYTLKTIKVKYNEKKIQILKLTIPTQTYIL